MLRPDMTNVEIALDREWVEDRSDYIVSLYYRYGDDLRRVRSLQRELYKLFVPHGYFGDVEGEFLYLSMRELQPEVVVDVGVGCGCSTSWLLRGLVDNGHGHLTSCDIVDGGVPNIRAAFEADTLARIWTFLHGDSAVQVFPDDIDFLLSDSSHDGYYSREFNDVMFPKVKPGGRICVHDVFMLPKPGHGEATEAFIWLDRLGIQCYSTASCFVEQHAKIQEARKALGLGPTLHVNELGSMLIFDVPLRAHV